MASNTKTTEQNGHDKSDYLMNLAKKHSMLIALIAVFIIFGIGTEGRLLLPGNISNLISQNGHIVILAIGMLMCILSSGSIDLSVGSVVCLVAAVGATMMVNWHMNIGVSIVACLILGTLIGAWQGFWIAYIRIPAFIVTLAGMLVWRGVALMVLGGFTIAKFPQEYLNIFNSYIPDVMGGSMGFNLTAIVIGIVISAIYIGFRVMDRAKKIKKQYEVGSKTSFIVNCILVTAAVMALCVSMGMANGIPGLLILLAVIIMVYSYFTRSTVPGRHLYAMGGNEKAAKLSGVNTDRVFFFAYVNMGFLCAVAALVCLARFNSAYPQLGQSYELDAIAACFIGGASAYGGVGAVTGAVIGAAFMGTLNMGMSIMGIDANLQMAVKGLVLLAAVAFDVISKRKTRA